MEENYQKEVRKADLGQREIWGTIYMQLQWKPLLILWGAAGTCLSSCPELHQSSRTFVSLHQPIASCRPPLKSGTSRSREFLKLRKNCLGRMKLRDISSRNSQCLSWYVCWPWGVDGVRLQYPPSGQERKMRASKIEFHRIKYILRVKLEFFRSTMQRVWCPYTR